MDIHEWFKRHRGHHEMASTDRPHTCPFIAWPQSDEPRRGVCAACKAIRYVWEVRSLGWYRVEPPKLLCLAHFAEITRDISRPL